MMDNKTNLSLPKIEAHETNKYNKHINELIENAEIEAEMAAEKKIRSKNSKIFLISIIGFGLLSLVYFQINDQNLEEATPFEEPTAPIKTAEVELAKQVPVVKDGSSQIPFPSIKKPKSIVEPTQIIPEKKPILLRKQNITSKPQSKKKATIKKTKLKEKITTTPSIKTNNAFFVQTGAFSLKENANVIVKKLKKNGFTPIINVVPNGQKKTYLVQLGVFPNKDKAKLIQEKLSRIGYPKTIIK